MSSFGDRIMASGRKDILSGVSLPPNSVPAAQGAIYSDFSAGLVLSDDPRNINPAGSQYALDTEVTRDDRIVRASGILEVEDVGAHDLLYVFTQAGVDYATELLAIDPPFIGVKDIGNFAWYNVGLPANTAYGWAVVNTPGTLIFSNGINKTYTRDSAAIVVNDISAEIVARCFATAFGRVFAGGYVVGGTYQAVGMAWNAANGLANDWTSDGAGSELLLADTESGNKIMAMHGIGFNYLGILCRNSLWIGTQTGRADRPADFKERFKGVGAVNAESAVGVPDGVMFLSDEGVVLFTPNSADVVSGAINPGLLPLDYARITEYTAAYQPERRRYVLCTPFCTWVYEFPIQGIRGGRWFKRSAVVDKVITFNLQSGAIGWDTVVGDWDSQSVTWEDLVMTQANSPSQLFFTLGSKLGIEDAVTNSNFGTALDPVWRFPHQNKDRSTDLFNTVGFEVEYVSYADSDLTIVIPDHTGLFTQTLTRNFPNSNGKYTRKLVEQVLSGQGIAAQLEFGNGVMSVSWIKQLYLPAGPGVCQTL